MDYSALRANRRADGIVVYVVHKPAEDQPGQKGATTIHKNAEDAFAAIDKRLAAAKEGGWLPTKRGGGHRQPDAFDITSIPRVGR